MIFDSRGAPLSVSGVVYVFSVLRAHSHQTSRVASSQERHLMRFILTHLRSHQLRQPASSQHSVTCVISWRMDAFSLAEEAALLWLRRRRRKNRKQMWIHELNTKRPDFGSFCHLFPDLVTKGTQRFYSNHSLERNTITSVN